MTVTNGEKMGTLPVTLQLSREGRSKGIKEKNNEGKTEYRKERNKERKYICSVQ